MPESDETLSSNPAARAFGARVIYGSPLTAYILALLFISGAALLSVERIIRGARVFPFVFFYPAIVVVAYLGGLGPGLVAVPLSAFFAFAFFPHQLEGFNWLALGLLGPVLAISVAHLRYLQDRNRVIGRELINFKMIGDHASDWNLLLNDEMRIRYVNFRAATDLGWSEAELRGRSIESLVAEEHQAAFRSVVESCGRGTAKPVEIAFRRRDNTLAEMEIGCTAVDTDQGRVLHVAARDVAERKQLARKLEELRHWESLRTMAGGLAHEFNNQFTSILGNVALAKEAIPEGHQSEEMLDAVIAASRRSTDLVQMMLATSGYKPRGRERLRLADLVDSAVRSRPVPDNIRIDTVSDDVVVTGDRQTFDTLFWSLISNAAEAYDEGGGEVLVTIRDGTPPPRVPDAVMVEEGTARPGDWSRSWWRTTGQAWRATSQIAPSNRSTAANFPDAVWAWRLCAASCGHMRGSCSLRRRQGTERASRCGCPETCWAFGSNVVFRSGRNRLLTRAASQNRSNQPNQNPRLAGSPGAKRHKKRAMAGARIEAMLRPVRIEV